MVFEIHTPIACVRQHSSKVFDLKGIAMSHGRGENASCFSLRTCIGLRPGNWNGWLILNLFIIGFPTGERLTKQQRLAVPFQFFADTIDIIGDPETAMDTTKDWMTSREIYGISQRVLSTRFFP